MMVCSSSSLHLALSSFRFDQKRQMQRSTGFPHLVAALALGCVLGSSAAGANGQSRPFATSCALKETTVITLIEDHAEAQDVPSDKLGEAGLAMLRARIACYEGRVEEALALYDGILNLGPVVSLRKP